MSTSTDLPCLTPAAPALPASSHGLLVPHEAVEAADYTVIVPTEAGVATLEVVIRNRCEMLASREFHGPGWRRIEHGLVSIAIRMARPDPESPAPTDSSAPTGLCGSGPSG